MREMFAESKCVSKLFGGKKSAPAQMTRRAVSLKSNTRWREDWLLFGSLRHRAIGPLESIFRWQSLRYKSCTHFSDILEKKSCRIMGEMFAESKCGSRFFGPKKIGPCQNHFFGRLSKIRKLTRKLISEHLWASKLP